MVVQVVFVILFTLLAGVPFLLILYLKYWERKFLYWKKKGIPHIPGKVPYGSSVEYHQAKTFIGGIVEKMCKEFPHVPYFGIYNCTKPILIVKDPDVVKIVLAKEFSHFRDRGFLKPAEDDVLSRHLFRLEGDEWRSLRVKITPVFTSGKLKGMFPLFVKCSEAFEELLQSKAEGEVSVKDLTRRFSTDVIVSCAFGLEADTIRNEDSPFWMIGQTELEDRRNSLVKWIEVFRLYLPFIPSKRTLRRNRPKEVEDFMLKTVADTVEHRENTDTKRNDFIDLLMQLRDRGNLIERVGEEELKEMESVVMDLQLMTAQCYVFFIAGHETSSSVKSFCLYELSLNPEIQERLLREIDDKIHQYGGLTYQAVQEMIYLDMVINEAMRKYPTLMHLDRSCTSDFTFPSGHKINKGTKVEIPVWAIHHDPLIYPEPDKFDPERFTKENKEARHPFAFLPFGEGPRICIGMRFGFLQIKIGLITILRKYSVERTDQTPVPMELMGSHHILTRPAKPIILKLTRRKKN